ncbi:MAG TPA: zinc dependent phospholipase C family protein [Chitinophagaceae bacterium]|nr:zinc dependent phospholipase C family protein [Chitinophagaceae bacterium]HRF17109.1 zinc dependent phospholipase C family protein [Chitinophagaceae bacterium]
MKKSLLLIITILFSIKSFCWGFYGHRKINYHAVFLLPPEMMVLFKPQIDFLSEHAVDPDKRRYAVPEEGPRHYIDIDRYGHYPYPDLPRKWEDAVAKYSEDTLNTYGIVPWWLQTMLYRLTSAFKEKNQVKILRYAAEIGHYIADAHVPLHANSNHNGQFSGQKGIHGFWESRVPELLAEKEWDFFIGKAEYLKNPADFIWKRVLESAAAADTVLQMEKELTASFPQDQKFSFEDRNGITIRQYSSAFSKAYDTRLKGMIERRMRQSIHATASFWYTAWVNAGQPDLKKLNNREFTNEELKEFEVLNNSWKNAPIKGREHE